MSDLPHIISDYRNHESTLRAAVAREYPIGSFAHVVRKGGCIPGMVHAYGNRADCIGLILEHGHVRWFDVDEIKPVPKERVSRWFLRAIGITESDLEIQQTSNEAAAVK